MQRIQESSVYHLVVVLQSEKNLRGLIQDFRSILHRNQPDLMRNTGFLDLYNASFSTEAWIQVLKGDEDEPDLMSVSHYNKCACIVAKIVEKYSGVTVLLNVGDINGLIHMFTDTFKITSFEVALNLVETPQSKKRNLTRWLLDQEESKEKREAAKAKANAAKQQQLAGASVIAGLINTQATTQPVSQDGGQDGGQDCGQDGGQDGGQDDGQDGVQDDDYAQANKNKKGRRGNAKKSASADDNGDGMTDGEVTIAPNRVKELEGEVARLNDYIDKLTVYAQEYHENVEKFSATLNSAVSKGKRMNPPTYTILLYIYIYICRIYMYIYSSTWI
jgi:hypothetical protein